MDLGFTIINGYKLVHKVCIYVQTDISLDKNTVSKI